MSASGSFVPAAIARLPWQVLFLVTAIAAFGVMVLYSAAGGSLSPWAANHAVRFMFFLGVAVAISFVPVSLFRNFTFPAYAVVLVLLIGVELIGHVAGGAQRWLDLGFMRLQPSEFMKPIIVLTIAAFYDLLPSGDLRKFSAIWPAAALIAAPAAFIMLQPDLGTALMVVFSGIVVMFLAGLPLRLFIGGGALIAAAIPVIYGFVLHDYQRKRVATFLDPDSDPLGTGYHISQSKIAIGSGGIGGKGFLNGTQSSLEYLPEGHTDFVFATMAEEWGLLGGCAIILGFGLVIRWGYKVAFAAPTRFTRLATGGLCATIFFYVSVNMMMVMGLAPVVGIPLPLFSYGGSAMMTVMMCIGMLMAIDRENKRGGVRGALHRR